MRLRFKADYRTLLWALAMPIVAIAQYWDPRLEKWLLPVTFYLAMAAGTIAHNHNHTPTFTKKPLNTFFGAYISVFYGYPTFAWVPTHNLNHHKWVNKPGDATITWRHTNRVSLFVALSYFFVSAYYQSVPIREYIKKARAKNPELFRRIVGQYVTWLGVSFAFLALGLALHPWKQALQLFVCVTFLPQMFGTWTMMFFNYQQHLHCDPWSKHNHSRNITGRVFNFLVFNAGLHTAHHENAGTHWSELPKVHAKLAPHIDPMLLQYSFWWYLTKQYILGPFLPSLRSHQLGRAPWDVPDAAPAAMKDAAKAMKIDAVDALVEGTNATMA